MTEINAAMVKALRDATGAGMMDCKTRPPGRRRRRRQGEGAPPAEGPRVRREARRALGQPGAHRRLHPLQQHGGRARRGELRDGLRRQHRRVPRAREGHRAAHREPAAPRYVSRDDVPRHELDRVTALFEAQAKESGKPENVIPKIVEGKLESF